MLLYILSIYDVNNCLFFYVLLRIVNSNLPCYNLRVMKRFTLVILTLFFILINTCNGCFAQSYTKKALTVIANDGFTLKATLTYPKIKNKKEYKTVLLLHSHGTNSGWWQSLPSSLLENGFAVLTMDLRGHGESVYNPKLNKVSWKSLTNNAYKKYPDDVLQVINYVRNEYPRMQFFNDWAIVGSDIGASAGVIAADTTDAAKPKTIVLLSPVVQTRGLYIPVHIAQLGEVDFLSISSADDQASLEAEKYLKKFAQNQFSIYTSPSKSSGMIILKNDPEVIPIITEWIKEYLKD